MKILITGICGFVGSSLARWLRRRDSSLRIVGLDSFIRPGSESNRSLLRSLDVEVRHGDVRNWSDFDGLPSADWVIDAAANPSVLAGLDGSTSTRQLIEHNLSGTVNVLEYCKQHRAGLVLLSTSRVYSLRDLAALPLIVRQEAFALNTAAQLPAGVSEEGIGVDFPTTTPLSLYGSTKLASEILALEYAAAFSFPIWVNRCGVIAGAGQFGKADQGIFSYWLHACAQKRPLKYTGFEGLGHQVRDALHPDDLAELVFRQINAPSQPYPRVCNVGGGLRNAMSLAQLSAWCATRFGPHAISADPTPRPFDIPWFVTDNALATREWGWKPQRSLPSVLEEIANHAVQNPHWLEMTGAV